MIGVVFPGSGKLGFSQRLFVAVANRFVAQTELFGADNHPYRDALHANAGIAANNVGSLADQLRHGSTTIRVNLRTLGIISLMAHFTQIGAS